MASTPSKILYVDGAARRQAGGSKSLLGLVTHLDKKKFTPVIACPKGPMVKEYKGLGIRTVVIPTEEMVRVSYQIGRFRIFNPIGGLQNYVRIVPAVSQLKSLIAEEQVDLVHSNDIATHFHVLRATKSTKTPIIWHIRNSIWDSSIFIRRWGKRYVDRLIFVSRAVRDSFLLDESQSGNMAIVPDGIDMDSHTPRSLAEPDPIREEFGIGKETPLIGIVGRMVPPKGHRVILDAVKATSRDFPDARFLIVGEVVKEISGESISGRLREQFDDNGLSGKVFMTGLRRDTFSVARALDILVCPFTDEGLSHLILEALASETPVVGADGGGIPEILTRGGGVLVPPCNAMSIVREVEHLIGNKQTLQKLGAEGRKSVRSNFNIKNHVNTIQSIYKSILSSR